MPKSEKLFEMVRYIREYPGLNVEELSLLCDVSVRGIYRYVRTLERAGIHVRRQKGGYHSDSNTEDFMPRFNAEERRDIRAGLALLANTTKDPGQRHRCTKTIQEIDRQYPNLKNGRQRVETVTPGVAPQHSGGSIIIGHGSKPSEMNPLTTTDSISANLIHLIFSSLVRVDTKGNAVPDLAKRWTVSDDELMWKFHLRNDVVFHDGHPLTADDVVFTYRSLLGSKMAQRYDFIEDVSSSTDDVVAIKLKYPRATMLGFDTPIAPKHVLSDKDLFSATFGRNSVGSGPFRISRWTKDDTITLTKNPSYYERNRPILDKVIFKFLPDKDSAFKAVSESSVDIILHVAASDVDVLSSVGTFRGHPVPDNTYYVLNLNIQKPPFDDPEVRSALTYAIDRQSLINRQLKGNSWLCNGPFPATYEQSTTESIYDPEKARSLLHECGWHTERSSLVKDDHRFEFTIGMWESTDTLNRLGYAIRGQLAKIGVSAKTGYPDSRKEAAENCDALLVKQPYGLHADWASQYWCSAGDKNVFSYQNDAIDRLFESGRYELNAEKRERDYSLIHKILNKDKPSLFLAGGCGYIGSRYNLSNVLESPFYLIDNLKDWQIQQVAQAKAGSPATREVSY